MAEGCHKMSTACRATQHSDQMICASCGLVWDTNDPDPPECRKISEAVIGEMFDVYIENDGGRVGMRAVYRMLQDIGVIK